MFAKLVAVSLLTLASGQLLAAECKVTVDSTDQMSFNTKEITIDKSCKQFTVELTHSGNLPKNVMGHNVVIAKTADMHGIDADGIKAGAAADYVKAGDTRVIAHSKVIGGGETTSVSIPVAKPGAPLRMEKKSHPAPRTMPILPASTTP